MTTITQPRPAEPKGAVNGAKLFNRLCAVCLTLFALIWLVPFVWALITSLRDDASITQSPTSIFAADGRWTRTRPPGTTIRSAPGTSTAW
ncbi:hypothetical protein ACFQ51_01345 [Streptomyces kaempferi]